MKRVLSSKNAFLLKMGFYCNIYKTLDLDLGERSYVSDDRSMEEMRWIMKIRGEVVDLNYKPWMTRGDFRCSLCNFNEKDVFDLIVRFPILVFIGHGCLGQGDSN